MTTMTPARPSVTGGVDTHRDEHVAAALDGALLAWLQTFGEVSSIGVEAQAATAPRWPGT